MAHIYNLGQIVGQIQNIIEGYNVGASMDAGFDAGKFSGPANRRAMKAAIRQICENNGFTPDQVSEQIRKRWTGYQAHLVIIEIDA